jgi:23S rRNA (cytosine1962-C5)-methyltransferase
LKNAPQLPRIILKAGREKSLLRRHPWVFSGAVAKVEGAPSLGATVAIHAADGAYLATAAFSPQSQIQARVWTWDATHRIDAAFIANRFARARAVRAGLPPLGGVRWVHGESDGLPGMIVDQYADIVSLQLTSAGADMWRDALVAAIIDQCKPCAIYERSDVDVRILEGLPPRTGLLYGDALPDTPVVIEENGMRLEVDIAGGHKTGFYLRLKVAQAVAARVQRNGAQPVCVLNCFCYTGGFSIAALKAGASQVVSVDSSGPALQVAARNVTLNQLDCARAQWVEADVGKQLRELRNRGESFDVIVLDPPKYAPTPSAVERAARAYKDINLLGLKLLKPGGTLFTYSCSGGVNTELFQKIVAGAATDACVDARIVERLSGAPDHPVLLSFPEGEYLKGLVLERL